MADKVELKYDGDVYYSWRVVHEGTDECVQRGGESLAYRYKGDAMSGIREFGLELMKEI